jgi:hypothetical protein
VVDEDTVDPVAWTSARADGSIARKQARLPRVIFARER